MLVCLPETLIELLYKQTRGWIAQECVPHEIKLARQANLEKPGKARAGELDSEHTRPITCMQTVWRAFLSSVAKSKALKDWLQSVGLSTGEAADAEAARVFQWMTEDWGYAAAQDYSSAYDVMRCDITCGLLESAGMNPKMISVLKEAWCGQVRYVQWSGHTEKEPINSGGTALPQGEPLGPFVMLLWITVGSAMVRLGAEKELQELLKMNMAVSNGDCENPANRTRKAEEDQGRSQVKNKRQVDTPVSAGAPRRNKRAPEGEVAQEQKKQRRSEEDRMEEISTNEAKHACRQGWRKEKTYMDDRTSTTTSANSLLVGVQEWERWSAEVLLRENASKLQLTARDERRRKIFRY